MRDKLNISEHVRSLVDTHPLLAENLGVFLDPVRKLEYHFNEVKEKKKFKKFKSFSKKGETKMKKKVKEVKKFSWFTEKKKEVVDETFAK